ncbi:2567_t:CDS:10 [Funneliformis mosseae]|uniref:2567_t:CDS:1 n=1 Tax=Funneliformis mosseae TaxID=27381 RepID=A0A9N9FSY4_FUNMO|nr:2567_t:CDS:10 [Funneliformis mosseae]
MTDENARWKSRLPYFLNKEKWSLIDFLQWSIVFVKDFEKKDEEQIHSEARSRPNLSLVESEKVESEFPIDESKVPGLRLILGGSGALYFLVASKSVIAIMKTLKRASTLNSQKIIDHMLNLHSDFSEALSNTTRETIEPALKRKSTSHSESENKRIATDSGNILPDGTILSKPPPPPNFIPQSDSGEASFSSQVSEVTSDDDDGEEIPDLDHILNSVPNNTQQWDLLRGDLSKKFMLATLRYGMSNLIDLSAHMRAWFSDIDIQHMMKDHIAVLTVPALDEEVNAFIADVEKMVQKGRSYEAYKFCLEKHINSPINTCIYKISKIYSEFLFKVKDGDDLLDCGEGYTEIDIIVKGCSYIVEGLRKGLGINCKCSSRIDLSEWEFSAHCTNTKAIGDRCRSSRMLLLDLINGFYVVFPGATFEIPTKLAHIKKLKSTVKIFKYATEMYEEVNDMLYELDHGYNSLNDVFNVKVINHGSLHYKSTFIHDPWWTPKKNVSFQLMIAFEEMENKQE